MRWGFAHPGVSASIFIAWLALNHSVHPAHLLLGAIFAWALPALAFPLLPDWPKVRHWPSLLRLTAIFLLDIVLANVTVARLILGPVARLRTVQFHLPIDARSEFVRTVLAGMITMTPGTLSVAFNGERNRLLVHTLDTPDAAGTIAEIKQRYEHPLIAIFEGGR